MKLQTRTSLYNILYSGIILIVTGFFLQVALIRIYYKQIDDGIITEREIIEEEIEQLDSVPDYSSIFGHQIEVSLYRKSVKEANRFSNVMLKNSSEKADNLYRKHYFAMNRKNGQGYTICILKPLRELHKFKTVVLYSVTLAFIFLMIAFLGAGYFMNRKLWKPFYQTLGALKQFNIDAPEKLNFSDTQIHEFRQLNEIISSFSLKMKRDYIRIKEFSENISHEINTMLAIITLKVELLLQTEDLSNEQAEHFRTIYQVTNNLIHLNNGLLLLAKIDNRFYASNEQVGLVPMIEAHIQTFEDFIRQREIRVHTELTNVTLHMNKSLCEILISNCISNAIKHNIYKGNTYIALTGNSFIITNSTAGSLKKDSSDSWQKHSKAVPFKSLGLGLEIIRRICRIYNFSFITTAQKDVFSIEIGFDRSPAANP